MCVLVFAVYYVPLRTFLAQGQAATKFESPIDSQKSIGNFPGAGGKQCGVTRAARPSWVASPSRRLGLQMTDIAQLQGRGAFHFFVIASTAKPGAAADAEQSSRSS